MRLIEDFSTSAPIAGFVAILIGFTSSAVIVCWGRPNAAGLPAAS
jgi:predicted benzoate:H+ symporter BenE